MAGTFKIELVSPERVLLSGEATEVIVPGVAGDFTVLAGHAPVISAIRPGVLDIRLPSGQRRIYVRGGFAEVDPTQLTILAQNLVDVTEGDAAQLAMEMRVAEQMLASATDDDSRLLANDAIAALKSLGARVAA
ncbi:MAG: F0F1 ATP synthase subunit epsilon [Hyphomicrobium sp.]|jgi:F-type H+-transporting ATPase subunit epsilon|uniref:F0F1 ATP synthase subunit epsilon n=1 Tax=Hyphomicrobium sp. CS1BSMeth3 TaxID=1892844 RepID=UPI00086B21A4|nr:F0F1 ATP synthase subunit epsilon [Hyphomicrobium sp. CS1BSMeth3]MBN9261007.1 F0F1 ATP synthase subunit epsilon [Hyphomicrobium sp.]ODT30158.1 MAG: ATP synthase F1 subunit epsilon [Hyphomicrobium sp. SCN 65-11]OJU23517.1 MAG: ATP synthase F1 subunit epsilon [Alphaproteobacteria bacterium 64-6]MBN9263635.1 F0F1 ATP synthase subunit epsilon [Hyphomicrobium sp.]MBN9278179.1 F0F1 ATP synthase subunit epsilon [Hyphomicrobium sp.]